MPCHRTRTRKSFINSTVLCTRCATSRVASYASAQHVRIRTRSSCRPQPSASSTRGHPEPRRAWGPENNASCSRGQPSEGYVVHAASIRTILLPQYIRCHPERPWHVEGPAVARRPLKAPPQIVKSLSSAAAGRILFPAVHPASSRPNSFLCFRSRGSNHRAATRSPHLQPASPPFHVKSVPSPA